MSTKSKGVRYSIWVPIDVLERLKALAREKGVTVSSLIVTTMKRATARKKRQ